MLIDVLIILIILIHKCNVGFELRCAVLTQGFEQQTCCYLVGAKISVIGHSTGVSALCCATW